jgi:hypothetical protein
MKILIYTFLISFFPKSYYSLIDLQNKKICTDCKFFILDKNTCKKFGDVNIITGDHDYEEAIKVRNDEEKCGEDAIFYEKNNFKFLIEPYKYAMNNGIQLFVISSYSILWIMFFTRFFN